MEKKISYLSRSYEDYKKALIEFTKAYYPELATSFNDASIGAWLVDLNAIIADELSYHIDRVFQETNINSASKGSSIYALARNNGYKISGPTGSIAQVKFSCLLPVDSTGTKPDYTYAPVIKKGTKVSSSSQVFEVMEDIDFNKQFNNDCVSDRTYETVKDGMTTRYKVSKLGIVTAGETKIYSKVITASDIAPFMQITLPIEKVMSIESIIVKEGINHQSNPKISEFYIKDEIGTSDNNTSIIRFFEVDSLIQQERWGESVDANGTISYTYKDEDNKEIYSVVKGEWKPVRHKFITEYTDKGYMNIIFGSGNEDSFEDTAIESASDFAKYQIKKTILNDSLGVLPKSNCTMFILYRVGGGRASNVAKGAIKNISYLNATIGDGTSTSSLNNDIINLVKRSLTVENVTPSFSGKDMPSVDELRYLIKYNNGSNDRCVTIKDYISRIFKMPSKYGVPFRVSGIEANNKIMLYLLGIDENGFLSDNLLPEVINNITEYLKNYRSINDFIEMKSGRIINLSFTVSFYVDKDADKNEVSFNIINKIKNYFDVNKHQMGDDIFLGDLSKELININGVLNMIDLVVFNEFGDGYSSTKTSQKSVDINECENKEYYNDKIEIDIKNSDNMLISEGDSMFEIKYPNKDIRIQLKER